MDSWTLHTVLTDFGLARLISQTSSMGTKTMLAGSPGFQSPEQLRTETIGPSSDVYAFGCVMVVTFKETPLWLGLNCYQIMQKVTNNEKPNTCGIPTELENICCRCFNAMPSRPSMAVILKELQRAITNCSIIFSQELDPRLQSL